MQEPTARKISKIQTRNDCDRRRLFKNGLDHIYHKTLRAIDLNSTLDDLAIDEYKNEEHWFRNESDMIDLFPNSLDAINNSHYLAKRCKDNWAFINTIFLGYH